MRVISSPARTVFGLAITAVFIVMLSLEAGPVYAVSSDSNHGSGVVPFIPAIDKAVKVGKSPFGIVYNPSNTNLYVPNNASGQSQS